MRGSPRTWQSCTLRQAACTAARLSGTIAPCLWNCDLSAVRSPALVLLAAHRMQLALFRVTKPRQRAHRAQLSRVCAGRVLYWELVEAAVAKDFVAHAGAVCSLAMHPEAALLLTAGTDGTIKVWR